MVSIQRRPTKTSLPGRRAKAIRQRRHIWKACCSRSEAGVFDGVHQRVQSGGREYAGAFLVNLAVGYARDSRQDHVTPIRQRTGPVVEMRASEDEGGDQQCCGARPKALNNTILDESPKENFFWQRRDGEDDQILGCYARR